MKVHLVFAVLFFILIMIFTKPLMTIYCLFMIWKLAGYTYGLLLGLFAFGILTKYKIERK
jgi:hypothetical protein